MDGKLIEGADTKLFFTQPGSDMTKEFLDMKKVQL